MVDKNDILNQKIDYSKQHEINHHVPTNVNISGTHQRGIMEEFHERMRTAPQKSPTLRGRLSRHSADNASKVTGRTGGNQGA